VNTGGPGVALVTGASRGIGRSVALALAAAGWDVACAASTADGAAAVAEECAALGRRSIALGGDAADPLAAERIVAQVVGQLGVPAFAVPAAGVIDAAEVPLWEADPADWWRVLEVDLRGPALLARALVPRMLAAGRGRLLFVGSGFGLTAPAYNSAYSVAKTAQTRLVEHLTVALEGTPVRAFDVSPGAVLTDMTAALPMFAGRTDWTPVERFCAVATAVAAGELDVLAGRFFHAGKEDVAELAATAQEWDRDARRLRLRPAGPDDPLA
jgi:NAD(P)-dependent dehydrogenase (short-subunit alcohol dehydrogenase family)